METVVEQTGPHFAKYIIYKFEIKIVSSIKSNEAWLQPSISYDILPLNRVMELYILYMQICNIHKSETFINMFIFFLSLSLNRLTPSRGGGV